jgi:hypothetical protein
MIPIELYISNNFNNSVFDFKTIHLTNLSSLVGMQFYFPENWTYEENLDLKKQWILGSDSPFYMLSFTGTPVTKTKLRSYTKMIGKNHTILSPIDYIQIEVDFEENKSTFACIIRLNKHNIDYCLKTFCHPSNTLIFCSEQIIFHQDTILSFVKNGLYQDNYWTINYEKMIPLLCEKGTFMLQSLADGGNRIFWRIFAHQSDKERISQNFKL